MSRTALVLSAGGMFGAYQAGVWNAIEDLVRPDLVVGASVGSLNGWMIAGGASGRELVEGWLQLNRRGIMRPAHAAEWIDQIYSSYRPTVEYAAVATELPSLRPRLFVGPELESKHLASSCAIPFYMKHHRIGGRFYSDGGLLLPAPVWAAAEMGADRIVSVNLLPCRPPLIAAAVRTMLWYSRFRPSTPAGARVIEISPIRRLGTMRESVLWSRERAARLIAMGEADGAAARPALAA